MGQHVISMYLLHLLKIKMKLHFGVSLLVCILPQGENVIVDIATVNVLKFRTLFSFCSQIKCWLSWQGLKKRLSESKQGRRWMTRVCPVL